MNILFTTLLIHCFKLCDDEGKRAEARGGSVEGEDGRREGKGGRGGEKGEEKEKVDEEVKMGTEKKVDEEGKMSDEKEKMSEEQEKVDEKGGGGVDDEEKLQKGVDEDGGKGREGRRGECEWEGAEGRWMDHLYFKFSFMMHPMYVLCVISNEILEYQSVCFRYSHLWDEVGKSR